ERLCFGKKLQSILLLDFRSPAGILAPKANRSRTRCALEARHQAPYSMAAKAQNAIAHHTLFGNACLFQQLLSVVVLNLGLIADDVVIRRLNQLLAAITQLLPDRLLYTRIT